MQRQRLFFQFACLLGALGVIIGAFGAHGLKGHLTEIHARNPARAAELLTIYETGVKYHLIHAVALLAITLAPGRLNLWPESGGSVTVTAAVSFILGILLFSGSLYVLAATDTPWLGAVTPFGGLAFLVGWLSLLFAPRKRADAPPAPQ